ALGENVWTPFFSEEGGPQVICPNLGFVTGVACAGRYCDNLSLKCTTLGPYIYMPRPGYCIWTGDVPFPSAYPWGGWLSEERGVWEASGYYYVAGVQCRGSYCDDMQFFMCPVIPWP